MVIIHVFYDFILTTQPLHSSLRPHPWSLTLDPGRYTFTCGHSLWSHTFFSYFVWVGTLCALALTRWLTPCWLPVTDPFGHINLDLQIITIRAHQTLIGLLHALNEVNHQNSSLPRDSMTKIIQKLPQHR